MYIFDEVIGIERKLPNRGSGVFLGDRGCGDRVTRVRRKPRDPTLGLVEVGAVIPLI